MSTLTNLSEPQSRPANRVLRWLQYSITHYTIQWLLVIVVIVLGAANVNFRQPANLLSILRQASFVGIGAAGMTLLMINGGIDLSVAGMLGLCGVVLALLLPTVGILPAILVALLLGTLLGILNSLIVTKLQIAPFIATLGTMNIFLAIGFMITNAEVVPVMDATLRSLGTGNTLGLPTPFVIMVMLYIALYAVVNFTTYGRFIRAVGSSETASQVGGIPVDRVRMVAFGLLGLCVGIAAVVLTGYLSSGQAIMATGYELRVIAAAVVGGTSLKGGRGTLFGTFTGALFFTVVSNALNLFNVGAYWQYVAVGLIIITALGIEALRHRFAPVVYR